jgi:hypothetical protein
MVQLERTVNNLAKMPAVAGAVLPQLADKRAVRLGAHRSIPALKIFPNKDMDSRLETTDAAVRMTK